MQRRSVALLGRDLRSEWAYLPPGPMCGTGRGFSIYWITLWRTNVSRIDDLELYSELAGLEKSLQTHARIENEILFPKAMILENQVKELIQGKVKLN